MEKITCWKVSFTSKAKKKLKKLSPPEQKQILDFVFNELEKLPNPMAIGKPLNGNLKGLWRYRVGNYRIICDIQKDILLVLVINVGHRKLIYKTQINY